MSEKIARSTCVWTWPITSEQREQKGGSKWPKEPSFWYQWSGRLLVYEEEPLCHIATFWKHCIETCSFIIPAFTIVLCTWYGVLWNDIKYYEYLTLTFCLSGSSAPTIMGRFPSTDRAISWTGATHTKRANHSGSFIWFLPGGWLSIGGMGVLWAKWRIRWEW